MFGKRLHKVTYEEIQSLLENKELFEGYRLDFKRDIGKKAKEVAKDVSSFANTNGGFLIYGIDDDENQTIVGIESIVNNRNVVEWFNQAVSGNVMPDIFYKEPHCIKIPGGDRVLMIVEIPESSRKPHMLSDDHRYYIRVNDSSRAAKHHEVRDMFSYSRERKSDFEKFYKERNLDVGAEMFGLTPLSSQIHRSYERINVSEGPMVVYSLLPKYINEDILKGSNTENISWLDRNKDIEIGNRTISLYSSGYDLEGKSDGYISRHFDRDRRLMSYFEVITTGYVEAGFSNSFCYPYHEKAINKNMFAIYQNLMVGYSTSLLKWAKAFYDHCGYREEFLFQVSFVDVLNCRLYGFRENFNDTRYKHSSIMNKHDNAFSIRHKISIEDLGDDVITEVSQMISYKISRTFGVTEDLLFLDGKFPNNGMDHFGLYGLR